MNPSDIRGGLDTSVVMRLLTGDPEPLYHEAVNYLRETQAQGQRLLVSDLVISEAYCACQFHYQMPKQDVLNGLFQLLSEPSFAIETAVLDLLGQADLARAKPGFVDRLIHGEYARQRVALVTFEKSASRLPGVECLPARDS